MIVETRKLYEQHRGKFSFFEKRRNRIPFPRGLAEDHPLLVTARDQKLLYDEGRIAYACVVDAHKSIYEKGNDVCEATVVFSEDEVFYEFPNLLAEVAIRVARLQDEKQAELPEEAVQTRTDFGKAGYGGAAPPKGETHRYIFTVHALDVEKIEVDAEASGAMVGFNVHFHSLASASITALFS